MSSKNLYSLAVGTFFLPLLLTALLLTGCGGGGAPLPDKLSQDEHASGDNQAGPHGELLALPFRAVLVGPQEEGMLGGTGQRRFVPNISVRYSVLNPSCGAVFEGSGEAGALVVTDAGGTATAHLRLGTSCGDVLVEASLPDFPDIPPVAFRALAGVRKIGKKLEDRTGGTIDEFGVQLKNSDGTAAQGVKVFFRVEGTAEDASVKNESVLTDAEGKATTSWKLGKKIQRYYASVEIRDRRPLIPPKDRFDVRVIQFKAMATNKREMLVVLLGGLAVFIFGMKLMSEGLRRMADRRLRSVLSFMTQNRFMAVGAGMLLTAMIQSSSATTVMTVGFVNAGLMTLSQAIGVVFGANIGTTVTAQIIAFRLDALAYPAIAVGLVMAGLMKKPQWKALGQAILGFGLLFLGMTTMSGILKPLRYSPEFVAWFQMFDCTPKSGGFVPPLPALMCIVIGTAMTCAIQSSSATVGLVMALASQGLISFHTALPLILGDNIGTTITANFAAIGTNRNARRTAIAHTVFNVFGAMYMYALLFVPLWNGQPVFLGFVDWITPGEVFAAQPENLLRHVANAHTAFNLFNVALFLPFTTTMAKVCHKIIPLTEADRDTVLHYLDPKLLQSPAIALEQAVHEVAYMVRKGQNSTMEACELLCNGKDKLAESILEREELIDRLQQEITEYLVSLSRRNLSPSESALIPALIHAVNDAERLGDHAEDLVELHQLFKEGKHKWGAKAIKDLREIQGLLNEQFEAIHQALEKGEMGAVARAIEGEAKITEALQRATDVHVKRLDKGKCDVQAGVIFLDALAHLDRVGDHIVNIAERAGRIIEVAKR